MDDQRAGRLLRALRHRRGLRQVDIARLAGIAQTTVSLVERGHLDRLSLRTLRRVFGTVDARFDGHVSWRGGATDRLLDERHALLVGEVAGRLRGAGWLPEIEVSFAIYGERGSIDLLAFHPASLALLAVEVKTELTSVEETIRRQDVKFRHAAVIARERFGWQAGSVGRLLVIRGASTSRRRVQRHEASLTVACPDRASDVRRWLRRPAGTLRGLLFVSLSNPGGARRRARPSAAPGSTPGTGQVKGEARRGGGGVA